MAFRCSSGDRLEYAWATAATDSAAPKRSAKYCGRREIFPCSIGTVKPRASQYLAVHSGGRIGTPAGNVAIPPTAMTATMAQESHARLVSKTHRSATTAPDARSIGYAPA